jgi:hypothetical protein
MLTRDATLALQALWDCGVIAASWTHPGYRLLRDRRLALYHFDRASGLVEHRLTERGRQLAYDLFRRT